VHDTIVYPNLLYDAVDGFLPEAGWRTHHGVDPAPRINRGMAGRKRGTPVETDLLTKVWKQRKFTDAEVLCDGQRIPVHRCTLIAASPVFEAAFTSAMREGESTIYEIKDSTPEAVEAMLCFVYTKKEPPAELLDAVFELAVQYELEELARVSAKKMPATLSISNVKAFIQKLKLHRATNSVAKEVFDELIEKIKTSRNSDLLIAAV
jgi:hypothetical protein